MHLVFHHNTSPACERASIRSARPSPQEKSLRRLISRLRAIDIYGNYFAPPHPKGLVRQPIAFQSNVVGGSQIADVVLCPDGRGAYYVGEIVSDYQYVPGGILPHRRLVNWYPELIKRDDMSQALRNSTGTPGTVRRVTKFSDEIKSLLAGNMPVELIATDELVEGSHGVCTGKAS